MAVNEPLIGGNFFKGHRAASSQFLCADANLSTKAELCTIGETGWGVDVNAGCIHHCLETTGGSGVLGDDAFAVTAAIFSNVVEGIFHAIYGSYSHLQAQPFRVPASFGVGDGQKKFWRIVALQGVVSPFVCM